MRLTSTAIFLSALFTLAGGAWAYAGRGSVASLGGAVLLGSVLLVLGFKALRRVEAGYAGAVLTCLISIYFAYRMIVTERLIPSGLLLMAEFLALFLILLGVFLSLRLGTDKS